MTKCAKGKRHATLNKNWRDTIPRNEFDVTPEFELERSRPTIGTKYVSTKSRKKVIKRLRNLWAKYPQLTLGELIGNPFFENDSFVDLVFMSDRELLERLEAFRR